MKKYTDVDIVAELQKLVDDHVDSYKEDFDIDKRIIRRAAESRSPEDKTLMWFCRPHGTHCLNENQVFIQGTRDHNTFRFYAEQTYDECIALSLIHISEPTRQEAISSFSHATTSGSLSSVFSETASFWGSVC